MSLNQLYIRLPWELTRLIIAIVNKAYVEGDKPMLDLFLDGFWHGEDTRGLISQLLLVAVDQTSFSNVVSFSTFTATSSKQMILPILRLRDGTCLKILST